MVECLRRMQQRIEIIGIVGGVALLCQKLMVRSASYGLFSSLRGGSPSEMGTQATSNSTSMDCRLDYAGSGSSPLLIASKCAFT
jgi:hypothetical protein